MIWILVILLGLLAAKLYADAGDLAATVKLLKRSVAELEARLAALESGGAPKQESAPQAAAPVPRPAESLIQPPKRMESVPRWLARDWEKLFAEHWLVWLGGLTLALGGGFLVKVSIDYGLLKPAVRVALGIALGVGLVALSEWVTRRDKRVSALPSYVAPALAAAGTATIFASGYAAYQLYDLISPLVAFTLLAVTAALALVLSLQHGPFVAGLGLLGAFVVPLLVNTRSPSALGLFGYLSIVVAASLALLRYRAWPWLAWIALAASGGWTLLWLFSSHGGEAGLVVAAFLAGELLLFTAFRWGVPVGSRLSGRIDSPVVRTIVRTAAWVFAVLALILVRTSQYQSVELSFAFLMTAFLLWVAYRDPALDDLLATSAALCFSMLALWSLPIPATAPEALLHVPPEQVARFVSFAITTTVLLSGSGFAALTFAPRPQRWAALSAAAFPAALALSYWRLTGFDLDIAWAAASIVVAGVLLAAAHWVERLAERAGADSAQGLTGALAAYAVGILGCTILAATFALKNAWLTVALAAHLPALGWVEGRLRLPVLRRVALIIALIAIVRLVLNPNVAQYPLSDSLVLNWILYGYGLPTVCFIVATRQFGSRVGDDLLVEVLEGGSALFLAALVTLELRHALGVPRIDFSQLGFLGSALQALVWLVMAAAFFCFGQSRARRVLTGAGWVLFVLATFAIVVGLGVVLNPLFQHVSVGSIPILDALTVAYGLPSVLYLLIAARKWGPVPIRQSARVLGLALAIVWVSLEVRHAFRGQFIMAGSSSDAEWYSYSVAWLAFAAACIGAGFVQRNAWLRRAGLLGVGLVIAKVFLSDMGQLEGLWRALSFLGLGGALVGIGYLYRFIEPERPEVAAEGSR